MTYPKKDTRNSMNEKFVENDEVELHHPAPKPRPAIPVELVKEHRTTESEGNKKPSQAIVIVHEQPHSGYEVEEGDSGKGSDDDGKGHGGTVSKHLYEIYVTHEAGKSSGGGVSSSEGDDGKGSDGSDGSDGGDDKSEKLVSQQVQEPKEQSDNGSYNVNINYGGNKNSGEYKGTGKKSYRKHKKNLKKKSKIVKPHKYEVKEYIGSEETKQLPVKQQPSGKESSPQHHKDSEDYSNGQFIYASEADSDAYYW